SIWNLVGKPEGSPEDFHAIKGEYITGKDRSYFRSLYQIDSLFLSSKSNLWVNLELIAFMGTVKPEPKYMVRIPLEVLIYGYRKASQEEIEQYLSTGQVRFGTRKKHRITNY